MRTTLAVDLTKLLYKRHAGNPTTAQALALVAEYLTGKGYRAL